MTAKFSKGQKVKIKEDDFVKVYTVEYAALLRGEIVYKLLEDDGIYSQKDIISVN